MLLLFGLLFCSKIESGLSSDTRMVYSLHKQLSGSYHKLTLIWIIVNKLSLVEWVA